MRRLSYLCLISVALAGCTGAIGGDGDAPPSDGHVHDGAHDAAGDQVPVDDTAPPSDVTPDVVLADGADVPAPFDTADTGPPDGDTVGPLQGWSGSASLNAAGGSRQVYLTWTAANGTPSGYRVFLDGVEHAELGAVTAHTVDGLEPDTAYTFRVEAGYAGAPWTTDGPSATATTDPEYDAGFRRLSEVQYNRTLADLHGPAWQAGCDATSCPWPRTADEWHTIFTTQNYGYWQDYQRSYPSDVHTAAAGEPRGGYRRLDQVVYDEHVASWMGSTMEVAAGAYEGWVGKHLILDPCTDDNSAGITNFATTEEVYENCMANFITDFGGRAFRRPLTVDEHASLMEVYLDVGVQYASENLAGKDLATRGLRNVIAVITSSPEFLYRVEVGDDNGNLTAHELASRLSFHFWNTMPDAELFAAAADGSLMTEVGYASQVDRLLASPRAKAVIEEFYRDFFRVQDFAAIDVQDGPASYHGGPNYNQYGGLGEIREAMQAEMMNLGTWFTTTAPGTYEDMFRSNLHFLECIRRPWDLDRCAGAGPFSEFTYGIDSGCTDVDCPGGGWDGDSPPVTLPQSQRVGMLTRLALLGHDSINARPIRRGLYIREALLCDPVPPPENCEVVKPPEIDVYMTTREKVEAITEQEGTTCAGCHSTLINGFGHALGHFSSKGQYWDKEHMFTDQQKADGTYWYFLADESEWADIDTTGTTLMGGEFITVDGPQEVTDVLAASGKLEACWSREYFRFAIGRIEAPTDAVEIEALADQLRTGATLADGFRAIVFTPQFKTLNKVAAGAPETP